MDLKSSVKNVTNSSPTTRGHVFVYIFMVVWNEPFIEIGVSGGVSWHDAKSVKWYIKLIFQTT